jgi:hypothetical protein
MVQMNGLADESFTGDLVKGSRQAGDRETGTEAAGLSACESPSGSAERSVAPTRDLRWLGTMSCMGSALITLVGAALITGHLLAAGDGKAIAEDEGSQPGYAVAAGSDS